MREYTFLALCSMLLTLILDEKTRVYLLRKKHYYGFLGVIFFFKIAVNGYLTGSSLVRYNPDFFLGVRLFSIPLEDFMFGFSMVTMAIIFWEYFRRKPL